ncbi:MAG TPA: hypothetical protein VOA41_12690 [Candidatus Dormibacteraeota bacterium]|nr:hypothetical protein [Candidatus Dormibacteraeota bacterium]
MRARLTLLLAVGLALTSPTLGQGPWAKKDWKKWSKDECKSIQEDSPWAQRWTEADVKMANFATRTSGTEGVGSESQLAVYYIMQFRSALPVRQALVREVLIQNRYDQMDPKQKEAVEKQTADFLNRKYDDVVVVHVLYGSNVPEYNRDLATFWQTHYPEGTVPQEAFLNAPRGQKVTPLRLISHKSGAQEFELVFPRMIDGKPLLEPGDKTMSVEFASPSVGEIKSSRVFVEFKIAKMMVNGQLVY